jgi:hypothetical protein
MISQENLTQYLANTTFKKIILPSSDKFTQKDYYAIKKQEMDIAIQQLSNIDKLTSLGSIVHNFQDDLVHKYKELMKTDTRDDTIKEGTVDLAKAKRVDYDTYLSYNENEMIPAPSIINGILVETGDGADTIRLYGNKNPESFYKSLLVLTAPDFMIKSKYERVAEICRVKKEIAFAVKNLFLSNKYNLLGNGSAGRIGFNKDKMIKNLLNLENYTDMPTFQVCADFMNKNMIIFDIAKKSFQLFISGPFDKLLTGSLDLVSHLRTLDWNMIILYNNAYLPVFCVNTHHLFKGGHIINRLMMEYEWSNPELYVNSKCRADVSTATNDSHVGSMKVESSDNQPSSTTNNVISNIQVEERVQSVTEPIAITLSKTLSFTDLKACKDYLLPELQNMAESLTIELKKPGSKGTFKNKTKQELYDELVAKLKPADA